jgi:flagellar basal body-associated protein FliL
MPHLSHRAKIVAVFIIIVAIGIAGAWFFNRENRIPQGFTDARVQANTISQKIVDISDRSTTELQQVNTDDNKGNYTDALTLTTSIVTQSQDLRDQAIALSDQIATMTRSLTSLSSLDAQQAALESISSRLALVSELVNYSGDLGKLLATLQGHFTGTSIKPGDVETLVNQINTDVNAINNFNDQATQAMVKFDSLTAKK